MGYSAMGMRVAACLVAGLSVSTARADFFQYQGLGTFELTKVTASGIEYDFETTVIGQIGGFGFTSFAGGAEQLFSASPGEIPDTVAGTGLLVGASPLDTLQVTFAGFGFQGNPASASVAATIELDSGTGAFAGLAGEGDLSVWVIFTSGAGGNVGMTLQGDLVPAPGTLALLTLGGLAAARRRRQG